MREGQASLISALRELEWPVEAANELARSAHVVHYQKRGTIFHENEAADLVYVLLSGEAKLEFNTGEARLLVSLAQSGQMLGVFAPSSKPSSAKPHEQLLTARALSPCTVAIIPTALVAHVLHRLPAEQLVRVLERAHMQWTQLCCRLLTYMTMGVRRRLTHAIEEMADMFGVADERGRLIPVRLSHEDFAALVGASRPMVSKHLKELTSDGVISKRRGRYVLLPSELTENTNGASSNGGKRRADQDDATESSEPHSRRYRRIAPSGVTADEETFGRVDERKNVRSI